SQWVRILFFINKLDAVGADASAVIDDIHEQLNVETLVMQTWDTDGKSLLVKRRLDEALFDELQAKSAEKQATSLSVLLLQRNIMPVFVGSAKLSVESGCLWGYQFHTERQPLAAEFSALVAKSVSRRRRKDVLYTCFFRKHSFIRKGIQYTDRPV
ncbi:MAG: hypothetical protein ACLTDS_15640, partial [Bianqueaceae bacterium]